MNQEYVLTPIDGKPVLEESIKFYAQQAIRHQIRMLSDQTLGDKSIMQARNCLQFVSLLSVARASTEYDQTEQYYWMSLAYDANPAIEVPESPIIFPRYSSKDEQKHTIVSYAPLVKKRLERALVNLRDEGVSYEDLLKMQGNK